MTTTLVVVIICNGAPDRIRTYGLLIRSQALYPTELRAHYVAEEEGFEPSLERLPYYRFSKPAPSANLGTPPRLICILTVTNYIVAHGYCPVNNQLTATLLAKKASLTI